MDKLNCWEVMGCGLEPDGRNASKKGICSVAQNYRYHEVNGGIASGRFCWTEPDTNCIKICGKDFKSCLQCLFLKLVKQEEGENFIISSSGLIRNSP